MNIFSTKGAAVAGIPSLSLHSPQAAVYAATGCSMATGAPSLCVTFGIDEALQAASAALTPWGDKVPVAFVTVAEQKYHRMIRGCYSAVTRGIFDARDIDSEGGKAATVLRYSRPIQIIVPGMAELEGLLPRLPAQWSSGRDPEGTLDTEQAADMEKALGLMKTSGRPVILLGLGGTEDIPAVLSLAEKICSPVLLTSGATTMPAHLLKLIEARPVPLIIPAGSLVWTRAFSSADVILALGSGFSEVDWFGLQGLKIHRARVIRVAVGSPGPPLRKLWDISIDTPVRRFLAQASGRIEGLGPGQERAEWVARLRRACDKWKNILREDSEKYRSLPHIEPGLAAHEIVARSPENTIFVSEGGACGMWLWTQLWLKPLVFPVQMGTIGVTIPMTIGAHAGSPGARVWGILGDGAFYYNARELATLSGLSLPVGIFVFNDSSWGAIRLGQTFVYKGRYIGTDIPNTDYARIARWYGCEGITARNPGELLQAVERVKASSRPTVVDVKIPRDSIPYAGASFVLAEFDGVQRHVLPNLVASGVKNAFLGRTPLHIVRLIVRMMR